MKMKILIPMSDDRTEYEQLRDLALSKISVGDREDFDERAGIMRICGGLSKVKAERDAFRIITKGGKTA